MIITEGYPSRILLDRRAEFCYLIFSSFLSHMGWLRKLLKSNGRTRCPTPAFPCQYCNRNIKTWIGLTGHSRTHFQDGIHHNHLIGIFFGYLLDDQKHLNCINAATRLVISGFSPDGVSYFHSASPVTRMQLISIKCTIFNYIVVKNINFVGLSPTCDNAPQSYHSKLNKHQTSLTYTPEKQNNREQ